MEPRLKKYTHSVAAGGSIMGEVMMSTVDSLNPVYTIQRTVLNEQLLFIQPVVKPGCTTGLTTGCIHDTAVCQTGCQTGLTTG